MQSGILHRDTMVETRVDVLVFAHGPHLRSASTAHGIIPIDIKITPNYREKPTL